jgi:hypothetical protein
MAKNIAREIGLWKEPKQQSNLKITSVPSSNETPEYKDKISALQEPLDATFNKPATCKQHSAFQMYNIPSIRTPATKPKHYTKPLEEAAKDFETLLLAHNASRVPYILNPNAPEFRRVEDNIPRISSLSLNPHALEFQGSSSNIQPSDDTTRQKKNLESRVKELEDQVSRLKVELQEHLANSSCDKGSLEEGKLGQEAVKTIPTCDGTHKKIDIAWGEHEIREEYDGGDLMEFD